MNPGRSVNAEAYLISAGAYNSYVHVVTDVYRLILSSCYYQHFFLKPSWVMGKLGQYHFEEL